MPQMADELVPIQIYMAFDYSWWNIVYQKLAGFQEIGKAG
jgi:hypothetical protein